MTRRLRMAIGLATTCTLLFCLAPTAGATPQMRITKFTVDRYEPTPGPRIISGSSNLDDNFRVNLSPNPETRAGAHPDTVMQIDMCDVGTHLPFEGCSVGTDFPRRIRDLKLSLPPGMLGNPNNIPACAYGLWLLGGCPDSTIVGWSRSDTINSTGGFQLSVPVFVYNVQTLGFEAARLGTGWINNASPPTAVPSIVSVRTSGDFGIDALTPNIPTNQSTVSVKIKTIVIVLFGQAGPNNAPFFVNPTKCGTSRIDVRAEAHLGPPGTGTLDFPQTQDSTTIGENHADIDTTGCDSSDFTFNGSNPPPGEDEQPSVQVDPQTTQAGEPTGYNVKLHFPDSEQWDRHQSHLKDADIALPDGVALSAPAGNGLEACTPAQWGVVGSPPDFPTGHLNVTDDPVRCPTGSEIGDVKIETPVLPSSLNGKAYFAKPSTTGRPTDAHPWKLLIAAQGSGLLVKLAGDVTVDADGTIHTKFVDNPQTPFTNFELALKGGAKSVLQNPRTCGTHTGHAELSGWNGGSVVSEPQITTTGCQNPEPFDLTVNGTADNEDAGASSPSHLTIDRPDGNQLLKDLRLSLPAGLVGGLTSVPLCSGADAENGTCGDDSKIGSLRVTVGTQGSNIQVPGSLFLARPTDPADVATLGIVIPAKVGPIDLGEVVMTNHVRLRQSDGGLDAQLGVAKLRNADGSYEVLDKVPTQLAGIPLSVKQIGIDVDRPGFLSNPTGCDPRRLSGIFEGDAGGHSEPSVLLTAKNCDKLPFAPHLKLEIPGGSGNTHKGRVGISNHTPLKAIVTQSAGQASIKRAVVKLPEPIRPDTGVLNKPGVLCTTAQATIGACQPQSLVGSASVITPLLPEPLTGPVYIVQDPGNVLPKLLVQLRGMASIDLVAGNRIEGVRTVNTFDDLPDVPQSRFELNVNGGPGGILFNFSELCQNPSTADATFTGHNGKTFTERPELQVDGCSSAVGKFSISGGKLRVSRRGVVKVKVACPSQAACEGRLTIQRSRVYGSARFSVAAGKSKTVKVKLSKQARKLLKRKSKIKVRLSGRSSGFTVNATATLVGSKGKKKK